MPYPAVKKKPVPCPPPEPKCRQDEKSRIQEQADRLSVGDRKGKGKEKIPVFELLPGEIIQEILYAADPDTFDSLTLLNSKWYHVSRCPRLYAYQLAKCGATAIPEESEENLPELVRLFTATARRELFQTFLRPRVTEIQLICAASSSAAAFPGGEAFRFEFSAKGTHLLALSSSRIFVLDLSKQQVRVTRELKISKRPVAATILDDGSILAVLSSNHHVTLYSLHGEKAEYLRSLPLDNEPRTIALSPGAEVLGAAFDGGIEVYSLHADALPTDRRAVNCDNVDTLAFSADGTILLGTTLNTRNPTTVILSAEHFSTDMPCEDLAQLWTTQVLFPRSSRDSSYATLLPDKQEEEENTWTFTYDRVYETFRAVRVDDLRNGHTYFTGPREEGSGVTPPSTLPAPTRDGGMVAAGFGDGKLYVYGLPEQLDGEGNADAVSSPASTPERSNSNASERSRDRSQLSLFMVPQWQVLRDKKRNVFIEGREIGHVDGLAGVKFVKSEDGNERLVTVAGGGVDDVLGDDGVEEFVAIGGGRVTLYEFGRGPRNGEKTVISVEIGDGVQGPVETLEEENRDIEDEVNIVRRRTVAMRRNTDRRQTMLTQAGAGDSHSLRAVSPTPSTRRFTTLPASSANSAAVDTSPLRRMTIFSPGPGESEDVQEDLDLPYVHGAPRSRQTLYRAATVARRMDQNRYANVVGPDGRPLPSNHAQTSHGRQEEEWAAPPPPYTPRPTEDNNPLPAQLIWSMQGPPRPDLEVRDDESSENRGPQQRAGTTPLARTRTTLGNVMRRRSIFRLSTTSLVPPTPNITATVSAPATPADGTSDPALWGAAGMQSPPRRGSAADVMTYQQPQFSLSTSSFVTDVSPVSDIPPVPAIPQHHLLAGRPPQLPPQPSRPSRSPGRSPSRRNTQLRETYAPGATVMSPGVPATPVRSTSMRRAASTRASNSAAVRRYPSRAERSAAINMRDARRKKGSWKGDKRDGKNCVVM